MKNDCVWQLLYTGCVWLFILASFRECSVHEYLWLQLLWIERERENMCVYVYVHAQVDACMFMTNVRENNTVPL